MTTKYRFRLEMRVNQETRQVDADSYCEADGWMIFYKNPAQGGKQEYWRVRLADVVSMETRYQGSA